jgi:hypothetical protein
VAPRIPAPADGVPQGKHDDQVDSTAQMLDWVTAGSEPQGWMWQMYKERAEEPRTVASRTAIRSREEIGPPPLTTKGRHCRPFADKYQELEHHRAMSAVESWAVFRMRKLRSPRANAAPTKTLRACRTTFAHGVRQGLQPLIRDRSPAMHRQLLPGYILKPVSVRFGTALVVA